LIKGNSYKQILKSTALIGGSEIIIILLKIIKTKFVAILLGPIGIGISGLFDSSLGLVGTVTKLGIGFSSIRDISKASESNDIHRISTVIKILRTWVWFTGFLGLFIVAIFSKSLSIWAFGDDSQQVSFILLSIVMIIMAVSDGQLALLQGLRRIGDLAKAKVIGVFAGVLIALPLYWVYGVVGIVPAIIFSSFAALAISWWFSSRVHIETVSLSVREIIIGGADMVRLGFFVVISGLISTGSLYLVRIFISQKLNEESVGIFQAAWSISTMYIASVLGAMAADYYPRLSAISDDSKKMNVLVNEQTEMALLIAGPLIVGMIAFLKLIIIILYTDKFLPAIPLLEWQLLGTYFKVISWPLGFVLLAKGEGKKFVYSELIYFVIYLLLLYFGWNYLTLEITGVAFLVSYIFYLGFVFGLSKKITGFFYSQKNIFIILIFLILSIVSMVNSRHIPQPYSYIVGVLITATAIAYSYYRLIKLISVSEIILKFKSRFLKR